LSCELESEGVARPASPIVGVVDERKAGILRTLGLDVHKTFIEVALHEDGAVQRVGRVAIEDLAAFAESLGPTDHVVLESTSVSWAIVDALASHAGRVTVSNPMKTKAIASAKVKSDKVDARVLAQLGAAEFVAEVWVPDVETRALRRRVAHRASLVRQRTRLRNQVHGVLARNLVQLPRVTDLFGKRGRELLAAVALAEHERWQIDSALRLHDTLQHEIDQVDSDLARHALKRAEVRRLMTIPGVGVSTALSLVSVIGDAARFNSASHLVGYLGLDPRVRQSGEQRPRMGHISRQGQAHARSMLIEAAHIAVRTPGPLQAFYLRLRSRRGTQIAITATARKLAVLCWHMLHNNEDYRHSSPRLSASKMRTLQRRAGGRGPRIQVPKATDHERSDLEDARAQYEALVADRIRSGG
jgi:transposase